MKKRIGMLFVLILLVLAFLGSCSGGRKDVPASSGSEEEDEIDFLGEEFLLITGWIKEFDYDIGYSASGDRMLARYQELKDRYNCSMKFYQYESDSAVSPLMQKAAASGNMSIDYIDVYSYVAYPIYKAGMLYSLAEIPMIDPSDSKWGPAFRINGKFDGVEYGFFSYDWEFLPQFAGILLSNTALIEHLGMTSPHEYLERGQWNWNNFSAELSKGTVQEDGVQYTGLLLSNDIPSFAKTCIFSNGGNLVKEENGKFSSGLKEPEVVAALNYMTELDRSGTVRLDGSYEMFTTSEVCYPYHFSESWVGTICADVSGASALPAFTLDDYGLLPFPYGPNGNEKTVSAYVHSSRRLNYFSLVSDKQADELGIVADLLFSSFEGTGREAWKEFAEGTVFHHHEDYENFVYMTEHIRYDYSVQLTASSSALSNAFTSVYQGKKTAMEALDTVADAFEADIEKSLG